MEASQQLTDWTHAVIKAESSGNALLLGRYQRRMNLLKLTETSVFLDAGQSLTVHERKHSLPYAECTCILTLFLRELLTVHCCHLLKSSQRWTLASIYLKPRPEGACMKSNETWKDTHFHQNVILLSRFIKCSSSVICFITCKLIFIIGGLSHWSASCM